MEQPATKTYPPLKIAFCGEGDAAFTWWTPMLLQSPAFEVVAVWSRHKAEALRLLAAITKRPCTGGVARTAAAQAQAAGGTAAGTEAAAPTASGAETEDRAGPATADVEVYWEEAGNLADVCCRSNKRPTCKNFLTLLHQHSSRVEAFFLVLPPDSHAATAEQVLSLLPDKHMFSATPPSLHSPTMQNLICLYSLNKEAKIADQRLCDAAPTQKAVGNNTSNNTRVKNSCRNSSFKGGNTCNRTTSCTSKTCNVSNSGSKGRGLWNVCCPFRTEVAVTKLQALMKDLGKVVTAELLASSTVQTVTHTYTGALPQNHLQMPQQQRASLLAVCCAYSSLLRLVLGDIVSLASVQGSTATVAGQLQFHGGVSCAITVDLSSKVTLFSLTIWGVKGFGKLCWNQERNAFEIRRYLHHYEHPTLHPVTGPLWGVKAWIENVWRQRRGGRGLQAAAEGDCRQEDRAEADERIDGENEAGDEEDAQTPERYLVDLLTSCALTDASGAVVQLRLEILFIDSYSLLPRRENTQ